MYLQYDKGDTNCQIHRDSIARVGTCLLSDVYFFPCVHQSKTPPQLLYQMPYVTHKADPRGYLYLYLNTFSIWNKLIVSYIWVRHAASYKN